MWRLSVIDLEIIYDRHPGFVFRDIDFQVSKGLVGDGRSNNIRLPAGAWRQDDRLRRQVFKGDHVEQVTDAIGAGRTSCYLR